jgi:hypothetical protein
MTTDETPRVTYWHLWTDEQGISRQRQCVMTEFTLASIGHGSDRALWDTI